MFVPKHKTEPNLNVPRSRFPSGAYITLALANVRRQQNVFNMIGVIFLGLMVKE